MLVFVTVWLVIFRKDFKFPRALILLVAAPAALYLLNAFRIAALMMIGNAGARGIAVGGFHSQAGWIAFNGVAFAMTIFVPRVRWLRKHPLELRTRERVIHENATAAYLLPFLAILAAGMFSRAMSADFEWFYSLRLAGACAALWAMRGTLRKLDWSFGWAGPTAGVAVFLLWIGLDAWRGTPTSPMPPSLSTASASIQWLWIALRSIAATTTVPIAEELAFRGFLMRRFQSENFESIALSKSLLGGSDSIVVRVRISAWRPLGGRRDCRVVVRALREAEQSHGRSDRRARDDQPVIGSLGSSTRTVAILVIRFLQNLRDSRHDRTSEQIYETTWNDSGVVRHSEFCVRWSSGCTRD